jgi:flagellar motor switch protein FliG
MGKRKSLFEFLGERLNDNELVQKGNDLKLGDIIAKSVPKTNATPLTNLTTQNKLDAILNISKKMKLGAEKKMKTVKSVTKSAKKKVSKKVTKVSKTKTKKRK